MVRYAAFVFPPQGWVRAPNLSALSDAFPFHLSDSKLLRKAVPILVEYTLRSRAFAR